MIKVWCKPKSPQKASVLVFPDIPLCILFGFAKMSIPKIEHSGVWEINGWIFEQKKWVPQLKNYVSSTSTFVQHQETFKM